jgi:hypothetical protein
MLKSTRVRGNERQPISEHRLILSLLVGVIVLTLSSTGWTDDHGHDRHHDRHRHENRKVALWVANSGGPNVLEFSAGQLFFKGTFSGKPKQIDESGVFVSPQDTLFDKAGDLWVVDGGNGVSVGEGVFEFSREEINRLQENPDPTPVFAITNSGGVPGFVFPSLRYSTKPAISLLKILAGT